MLVVCFYQHKEQDFEAAEIKSKLRQPLFLGSAGIAVAALIICFAHWRRKAAQQQSAGAVVHALIVAIVGSLSFTFGKMTVALLKGMSSRRPHRYSRPLMLPFSHNEWIQSI